MNFKQIFEMSLSQLKFYRDDGRVPSKGLLDDIAATEWLISQNKEKQKAYFEFKHDMRNGVFGKTASQVLDAMKIDWRNKNA